MVNNLKYKKIVSKSILEFLKENMKLKKVLKNKFEKNKQFEFENM